MNLLLAVSLFFGGIFSYIVLSNFLGIRRARKVAETIEESLVTYLAIVALGFSEIVQLKYEALRESNASQEFIDRTLEEDHKIYEAWKHRFAIEMGDHFPIKFKDMIPNYDWDGALRSLDYTYYNENLTKRG